VPRAEHDHDSEPRPAPPGSRQHARNAAERLSAALRARGLACTVQRRAVFECLSAHDDHPTAEIVHAEVNARLGGISRPTVYRVLDTLAELGLVRRVEHPGSAARFDARTDHHNHLICVDCGAVADFECSHDDAVSLPNVAECGFEVHDFSVHFTGRCARCAADAPGHDPRTPPPASDSSDSSDTSDSSELQSPV